jgi:hypothetical protein
MISTEEEEKKIQQFLASNMESEDASQQFDTAVPLNRLKQLSSELTTLMSLDHNLEHVYVDAHSRSVDSTKYGENMFCN